MYGTPSNGHRMNRSNDVGWDRDLLIDVFTDTGVMGEGFSSQRLRVREAHRSQAERPSR